MMTGCAIVSHDKLPKYSYSQIELIQNKVSIDYDYTDDLPCLAIYNSWNYSPYVVNFNVIMESVFYESNLFDKIYQGVDNERFHFSIKSEGYKRNPLITFTHCLISSCSLMVIPFYQSIDYVMTVDVMKEGNLIKTYKYDDGYSVWHQFFMIFWPDIRSQKDIQTEIMSNIVRNFLNDLQKDKILHKTPESDLHN